MASRHGPVPSACSSLSILCATGSLTAAVLQAPPRQMVRLAWSQPGTINVAATQIAAYISFGVEPWWTMSASDVNTRAGSTWLQGCMANPLNFQDVGG